MGTYELNKNEENYVKIYASGDGYTRADAVKFEYIGTVPGATALLEDNFSKWNMPGRGNAGNLTKENALFRVTDLRGRAIAENMSRVQVKNFMQSTDSALGAYIISVQSGNGIRSVKLYVK